MVDLEYLLQSSVSLSVYYCTDVTHTIPWVPEALNKDMTVFFSGNVHMYSNGRMRFNQNQAERGEQRGVRNIFRPTRSVHLGENVHFRLRCISWGNMFFFSCFHHFNFNSLLAFVADHFNSHVEWQMYFVMFSYYIRIKKYVLLHTHYTHNL